MSIQPVIKEIEFNTLKNEWMKKYFDITERYIALLESNKPLKKEELVLSEIQLLESSLC